MKKPTKRKHIFLNNFDMSVDEKARIRARKIGIPKVKLYEVIMKDALKRNVQIVL